MYLRRCPVSGKQACPKNEEPQEETVDRGEVQSERSHHHAFMNRVGLARHIPSFFSTSLFLTSSPRYVL